VVFLDEERTTRVADIKTPPISEHQPQKIIRGARGWMNEA
jgi:hypothetical protein